MLDEIMNNSVTSAPKSPVIRIGISGLPSLTNCMVAGGLYILVAELPSARFPMLSGSLAGALNDDVPCTLILPADPSSFIQRIESFGGINTTEMINADRLQVFVMQDEFPKKMFRFGTDSFIQELEQFEIPENSYLIFDQADELLSLQDISLAVEQVDVLKKWFAAKGVTALLVFSRATEAHASTLNALMDNLTGIVRLGGGGDGLEFTFDYWWSPEGVIVAKRYRLLTLDSGLYEVSTKITPTDSALREKRYERFQSKDDITDVEPHFFYMDPDLGGLARELPGIWQQVDSLVGMMHATRNTRLVTAILSFQHDTNLRQLAEAVYTLRHSLERHTQIVVHEKGASLRYQNEALLVRLGINLVIHRDVPVSRLPLLLKSLSGQIFNRDVEINFEAALASVIPTKFRGYLAPLRFVREVELILDRAVTLNIPCAMIVGKPSPGMAMVDIVAAIGLSRLGDLLTADGEYCYLFLNACPQSVMLTTLERILGVSVDAAFDDLRYLVRREDILSELTALTRTANENDIPDYSLITDEPTLLPHYSAAPVIEEVPFFTQDQSSTPSIAASESKSADPVSALFKTRLGTSSNFEMAKRPTAAADAASKIEHVSHYNGFDIRTKKSTEASIANDGNKVVTSIFGKKQIPRATRST